MMIRVCILSLAVAVVAHGKPEGHGFERHMPESRQSGTQAQSGSTSNVDIDDCFMSYCEAELPAVIQACHDGGYSNCDSMTLHALFTSAADGSPAYGITNTYEYDVDSETDLDDYTTYSTANSAVVTWNNQNPAPKDPFVYTFGRTETQTTSYTMSTTVSDSLTTGYSLTMGPPELFQEQFSVSTTEEVSVSTSETQSSSYTQDMSQTVPITVGAYSCVNGCSQELSGDLSVPYTAEATIKGAFQMDGWYAAGQCCYLRPGGSAHCGGGFDPDASSSDAGWSSIFSAGYATYAGTRCSSQGMDYDGDDVHYSLQGEFKGGTGFSTQVATWTCGQYASCEEAINDYPVCNPNAGCQNTCDECCQTYLADPTECSACIDSECVSTSNICIPDDGCNVCDACCKDYLTTQTSCNSCVAEQCTSLGTNSSVIH